MVPLSVAETPLSRRTWRDRAVFATLAVSLLVAAFATFTVGSRWLDEDTADADPTSTTTSVAADATTTTAPASTAPVVPASTIIATPNGEVPIFDKPNGTELGVAGRWYGYAMTMPVVDSAWGWVEIMLPERPNGSTAWVRTGDVALSTTDYRIVVDVGNTKVHVYKGGVEAFSMPAGMGKSSTPTPPGHFFVAVIEKPGSHGYGPIVLDLSAHSEAIQSWQGAGDAIIALHGSFGADRQIGTEGTHISNGCIRLHIEDQLKLDVIPLGTPVDIIA